MRAKIACGMSILALGALPVLALPVATESLSATGLTVTSQIAYERAILRVSGPEGYYGQASFEIGESIQVDLSSFGRVVSRNEDDATARPLEEVATLEMGAMPDGSYNFEVVFMAGGKRVGVHTSTFFVEGGLAIQGPEVADLPEVLAVTGEASGADGGGLTEGTSTSDFVDINDTAGDNETHVWLGNSTFPSNWWLQNEDGNLRFREWEGTSGGVPRVTIEQGGEVGIGTTAPAQKLHLVDDFPRIRVEGSNSNWELLAAISGLWFRDVEQSGFVYPVRFYNGAPGASFVVQSDGSVGIGTESPAEDLHVRASDPQILVESSGATTGRTLAYLKNSGDVRFFWENTASGDIWQMSMLSTVLQMSSPTGVGKFRVRKSGGLQALNGSTEIMALNSTGDLTVKSVTQTSSRVEKRGFETVDGQSVLDKVAALPISEWSYKADSPSVRHIGPMSEDFHAAFGLGKTDKGLTSVDTTGVALAAIQGLNQKLAEKDARISELEQRLLDLEEMVQALAEH